MKNSIRIDFPSYEVMVEFCQTFDLISDHFIDIRNRAEEEGRYCSLNWKDTRFSVLGTEVSDATSHELFQYFYNGSTGGFDWETNEDGSKKLIRKGIINPRGLY